MNMVARRRVFTLGPPQYISITGNHTCWLRQLMTGGPCLKCMKRKSLFTLGVDNYHQSLATTHACWGQLIDSKSQLGSYPERIRLCPVVTIVSYQRCAALLCDPAGQVLHHNPSVRADLNMLPLFIGLGRNHMTNEGWQRANWSSINQWQALSLWAQLNRQQLGENVWLQN